MESMIATALLTIGIVASLLAALCTAIIGRFSRRAIHAAAIGSLIVPLGFCIAAAVATAATMEVDGPPPGMVLGGILTLTAMMLPCTTAASFLTIRFMRRRG